MKGIYILKEMNKICFKKIYANDQLKRFKIKNIKNSLTEQTEIYELLNIMFKNSIGAIKKLNIINKNVRIDNKI